MAEVLLSRVTSCISLAQLRNALEGTAKHAHGRPKSGSAHVTGLSLAHMLRSLHHVAILNLTANAPDCWLTHVKTHACSLLLSAWLGLQSQTCTRKILNHNRCRLYVICMAHPPPKKSTKLSCAFAVMQGAAQSDTGKVRAYWGCCSPFELIPHILQTESRSFLFGCPHSPPSDREFFASLLAAIDRYKVGERSLRAFCSTLCLLLQLITMRNVQWTHTADQRM